MTAAMTEQFFAFGLTALGTAAYIRAARKGGVLASPNFRSLHEEPVPSGGGLVIAVVFLASVLAFWIAEKIPPGTGFAIAAGGSVAACIGFIDDRYQISALLKLAAQCTLAAWIVYRFGEITLLPLPALSAQFNVIVNWLALVWLMNLYNFIDGIDGMAASGGGFIAFSAAGMLALSGKSPEYALLLGILGACCTGFLTLNWPPAKLFMGDSGSLFLGFCFGAMIVPTAISGDLGIWTWLILFGYFVGDTTTTTVIRIFVTPKWYGEHRSHAYQNLARILRSHLKVTSGVLAYKALWLLPLAVWSFFDYTIAPIAALAAIAPVVAWTLRFGPRLSSS